MKTAIVQQSSRIQICLLNQLIDNDCPLDEALKNSAELVPDVGSDVFTQPGLVIHLALQHRIDLSTLRVRFETCSTLTDATVLVNALAKAKLDDHDPPVVQLSDFTTKLLHQQQSCVPPDLLETAVARQAFAESLLDSTIVALTGAGVVRITDSNVVLQPIQWLAKKLGVVIEKYDPQHSRHGVLDIEFLDKTCNVGAKHGHALLELLVAEGLACWTNDNQHDSVLIPLMMEKATHQHLAAAINAAVDAEDSIKVGRRFSVRSSEDGGVHDQLPAGFFNTLQVNLIATPLKFRRGEMQQLTGLSAVWAPLEGVQQAPLLIADNHGHYFDLIAVGPDRKSAMHALRVGCGFAGACWQAHSGLALVKTALCVQCTLLDKPCTVSTVPIDTTVLPAYEQWQNEALFGVQFEAQWRADGWRCRGEFVKMLCRANESATEVRGREKTNVFDCS